MNTTNKLFVYGILKRGFQLDLTKYGCKFLGEALLTGAVLHKIGDGTGLRFSEDPLEVAFGEVFEIDDVGLWAWLDEIEANGHNYNRVLTTSCIEDSRDGLKEIECWVYEHIACGDYKDIPTFEDGVFTLAT